MKLSKEDLEKLYASMSLEQMAEHLKMSKSTLYYHMRKFSIECRSKSEAQSRHLNDSPHQRLGKKHSEDTKEKISSGTRVFWDSKKGTEQKTKLGELRQKEWSDHSKKERLAILNRLQKAERPSPGELSKFGVKLAEFLGEREGVVTGIRVTPSHISDIILPNRKVIIELLLPIAVYGDEQESKIEERYDRLIKNLNDANYRVVVIEDLSNSISRARCQRVYNILLEFFENSSLQRLFVVS